MSSKASLSLAAALLSALCLSCGRHADGQPPRGPRPERILSEDGREWLNPLPKDISMSLAEKPKIPAADIYEVKASEFGYALVRLGDKSAIPTSEVEARALVGPCLHSESDKRPFLVRAVYCGEGGFDVYLIDADLAIINSEPSHRSCPSYHKTILVLNLSRPPQNVYLDVHQFQ